MSAPTRTRAVGPAALRSVLGTFCTGVTVITALGPDGPLGFSCQSFASLSLDPPLILISPSRNSTTWPKIREIGHFCVNILAEEHEQLSGQMARSGTDKFADVEWDTTPLGAPRLSGTLAWLDCAVTAEYDGGDHTIVVAEVHDLAASPHANPLLYYRSKYAALDQNGERA
ncbi:flavin reductase family protein [Streptomyces sp. NPDC058683]|uniref:flavin reductase family protein n=1 Tax=Streptomyces sp. NPDC058683 TaxID=3346597 RepID=UPI003650DF12